MSRFRSHFGSIPSAASATLGCKMVSRVDKWARFARWCIYFPSKPQVWSWKRTLRAVVEADRTRVTFSSLSGNRVELVWQKAVTYQSAARLVRLARETTSSFEILGEPTGYADGVWPPVEAAAAAPDEAAAPNTKRRRIVGKRLSAGPASASHVGPPADDASSPCLELATADSPIDAYETLVPGS
jgi:hypothetical protein